MLLFSDIIPPAYSNTTILFVTKHESLVTHATPAGTTEEGKTDPFRRHPNNTSQQDFVPRKVYSVSNVTFHAESKYAIKIFPSPTVFVQWNFLLLIFRNFSYFLQ
jgi:hypothetical protein